MRPQVTEVVLKAKQPEKFSRFLYFEETFQFGFQVINQQNVTINEVPDM